MLKIASFTQATSSENLLTKRNLSNRVASLLFSSCKAEIHQLYCEQN